MTVDKRDNPAVALGEIWEALDALPRPVSSSAAAATTIEMVAISAQHRSATASRPSPQAWMAAAVLVTAGFLAGATAGQATLAGVGGRFSQQPLPFIEHINLLVEAGSVEFLHEVDRRAYPPPRSFPMLQQPTGEDAAFEAAIRALRGTVPEQQGPQKLSAGQRRELEERIREAARLEPSDRRRLGELARALANQENEHLVEAARLWHAWVASRDPAERRSMISLSSEERLEWLDRYSRLQSRIPPRPFNDQGRPSRHGLPPRGEIPATPR